MWARGVMRRLGEPMQIIRKPFGSGGGGSLQSRMRNAPETLSEEGRARARALGVGQKGLSGAGSGEVLRPWESIEKRQLDVREAAREGEEVSLPADLTVGQQEQYLRRMRDEQKAEFRRGEAEDEARQHQIAHDQERAEAKQAAAEGEKQRLGEEATLQGLRGTFAGEEGAGEEFREQANREYFAKTGKWLQEPPREETPEEKIERIRGEAEARAGGTAAGGLEVKRTLAGEAVTRRIAAEQRAGTEWDRREKVRREVENARAAGRIREAERQEFDLLDDRIGRLRNDIHHLDPYRDKSPDSDIGQKALRLRAEIARLEATETKLLEEIKARARAPGAGQEPTATGTEVSDTRVREEQIVATWSDEEIAFALTQPDLTQDHRQVLEAESRKRQAPRTEEQERALSHAVHAKSEALRAGPRGLTPVAPADPYARWPVLGSHLGRWLRGYRR